jgi:enoyl-CoA hydratase/carnithine racemase
MSDDFLIERDGAVTIITINRPEARNALDRARHLKLSAIIDAFAADPEQRVAILTGAGDQAFCAGNDLKQRLPPNTAPVPETGFGGLAARPDLAKPVIAAVNGAAVGGGFELALACDLIIAADNAHFALPEVRLGLAPLGGALLRLPQLIGAKRTMDMAIACTALTAMQAHALGIVNEVTAPKDLLLVSRMLAERICMAAPLSIAAVKALLRAGPEAPTYAMLTRQRELPEVQAMARSGDVAEGARAFRERRAPRWTGE